MAEVFGLVASIISLIHIGEAVIKECCHYIGSVRNGVTGIDKFTNRIALFNVDLITLQSLIDQYPGVATDLGHLQGEDEVLLKATATLKELSALLGFNSMHLSDSLSQVSSSTPHQDLVGAQADVSPPPSRWMKPTPSLLVKLRWPLDERHVRKILADLESYHQSIIMALTICNTKTLQNVWDGTARTTVFLRDLERRQRLLWLCPKDGEMRKMHAEKRALQESDTCTWVTQHTVWADWLKGPSTPHDVRKFIWFHGIPGAGKTVLASYLVEDAAMHCGSKGCTYYYCHYSRDQDETLPLLKWIIRDLSRQDEYYVPKQLEHNYEAEKDPSVDELLGCLEELSNRFKRVYVIVDAVDESRHRDELLSVLTKIGTDNRFWKVSLLLTSRHEVDIQEAIQDVSDHCTEISMSNPEVRADIRRFIEAEMAKIARWRKLDATFLDEIRDTLSQGSRGMFRWASCQLDRLKRERDVAGIRQALGTLPRDLFATYERILADIPKKHQDFASTALALICSDTSEIPSAEILVKACLYSCNVPFHEIDAYTVETLQQICGCLITLTRQRDTTDSVFGQPKEDTQFWKASLAHLHSPRVLVLPCADKLRVTRYEEHCLRMSEQALEDRKTDIIQNDELRKIVLDTLVPSSPHLAHLRAQYGIISKMKRDFPLWNDLMAWEHFPVSKETGVLANLIQLGWFDLAKRYLAEDSKINEMAPGEAAHIWTRGFKLKEHHDDETLLSLCVRKGAQNFLNLFVRSGVNFYSEAEILYTAIRVFYKPDGEGDVRTHRVLKMLLEAGANPNPKPISPNTRPPSLGKEVSGAGFAFTPLQLAVSNLEKSGSRRCFWQMPGRMGWKLQSMGQQTPLEICDAAKPQWSLKPFNTDLAESARQEIERLLRRYGAKDKVNVPQLSQVVDMTLDSD
ncbi:hypothetical protein BJ170DRAFT_728809 [Xylariales sp. AK1849]|nr:hypothetical protein BJ170DRAFT_728809 [Xylariales sp. AK1849]